MELPRVVSYSKLNQYKNTVYSHVVLVLRSVVKFFAKYHIFDAIVISRHNVPLLKIGIVINQSTDPMEEIGVYIWNFLQDFREVAKVSRIGDKLLIANRKSLFIR